jgi:glycosyl hydrolase family 59 (putative galactocerebrosidase)
VTNSIRIDLSRAQTGGKLGGFSIGRTGQGESGEWKVLDDPSVPGGKVIAQTSADTTDYRFPLAIYDAVSAKNVAVTLRFKPVGGKVDQAGGIAVRLTSPDNYYIVRANALEDNVRFYRVANGSRQQIAGANTKVAANQWHTLGLRAEGDRFTVSFDGKDVFTAEDATFPGEGKVALWTKADSITHFDRIEITSLP